MKKFLAVVLVMMLALPVAAQERANARENTGASIIRGAQAANAAYAIDRSGADLKRLAKSAHAAKAKSTQRATVVKAKKKSKARPRHAEAAYAHGIYYITCLDANGRVKWQDTAQNVVTTVGKNLALDTYLAGSAYTVVGPFLGLISSVSYTAVAAADTMTSHAGWTEAGATNAPTYTAPRKTAVWAAASGGSKALSASLSFAITGTGTVKGVFLVYGTGALSTIDNTAGTLYSAGLFSGGDKVVANGDTLNVSYTASL